MKRFIILSLLILALSIVAVSAADVAINNANSFSAVSPNFGSRTQRASNPNHDTTSSREVLVNSNSDLSLTNNGASSHTLTGLRVVSSALGFTDKDLNLSIVGGSLTLITGETKAITLNARIPQQLDAVDSTFKETGFAVAVVEFVDSSNTAVSDQFTIFMQRENKLEFDDLDVIVTSPSGRRDTTSVSDTDDDIEGVKPGDSIEVKVEAENTYSDREDVEIENVEFRVEIDTKDFNEDDDDDLGDIGPDDKNSGSIRFEVDDDAEDDTGDIIFELDGEDEFGARHGETITVNFEIERESHDILIRRLGTTPDTVDCQDTSVQLAVDILNLGRSDEDEVAVEVSSKALGYRDRISNIELDEDDGETEVFDVTFSKDLPAGVYALEIQTFYDGTRLSNTGIAQFESVCGRTEQATVTTGVTRGALTLSQSSVSLQRGGTTSVGVQIANTEDSIKQFTARITGADEFAETVTSKILTLNPRQSTTVFFNLKGKADADEGTYSAQVVLESGTQIVDTETLTVKVEGAASRVTGAATAGLSSTTLWVIGDIILIVLAIAFIWFIFGGKKKPAVI